MPRPLILGLDIGTSSVRAALYDTAGKILPKTLIKNERRLSRTADGGSEIAAEKAFSQVVSVVDNVVERAQDNSGQITHVAVSCFWHSLVGVDGDGKPTTRVLSWADNQSREHVADLRWRLHDEETHDRTGARFHSSFWPAKLRWLKQSQPNPFRKTKQWLSLSDYLAFRLSGDTSTSVSMASATGIFDIHKNDWDERLLKFLKLRRPNFPAVAGREQTFRLNKRFARRWPRLANAEWFPAIGDGAANNIGSGCVTKHRAALMVGTSGAFRVAFRGEPPNKLPDGLWCYRIDGERVVLGGALSDGGGLYDWLTVTLNLPPNAERMIAKRPPAEHGLSFLPFLAGERSTGYHEHAQGAVLGLTARTDPIDIAQAVMESVGYRFAEIFDQLSGVADIREIYASGGALQASATWTQILTDILGRPLTLVDVREASLRGAVLLALETLGNIESVEEISPGRGKVFEPDRERFAVYQRARKQHERYYDLIIKNT